MNWRNWKNAAAGTRNCLMVLVLLFSLSGCGKVKKDPWIEVGERYEKYFSSSDYQTRAKIAEDLVEFLENNRNALALSCDVDCYLGLAYARIAYNREMLVTGNNEFSSVDLIQAKKERAVFLLSEYSGKKLSWNDVLTLLCEARSESHAPNH